jgi:ubiquitin carboxyl-terminal hydrolase 3
VTIQSSASSVTNPDDASTAPLRLSIDVSGTLSPPQSLTTVEDSGEHPTPDGLAVSRPEPAFVAAGGAETLDNMKDRHSLPKKTYSKKNPFKGIKRLASDNDGYDTVASGASNAPLIKRAKVVGLKNLGNTCYNNAVIQALSHTGPLRDYFLERRFQDREEAENDAMKDDATAQIHLHMARPRTRRAAKLEEQKIVPLNVYALLNYL